MEFSPVTPLLGLAAGLCLFAIQVRHHRGISLLQKEVRDEFRKPLDSTDKWLVAATGVCFVAFLASFSLAR